MKADRYERALAVARAAATKVKLPLDPDSPFGELRDDCYAVAAITGSSAAGALVQYAAVGWALHERGIQDSCRHHPSHDDPDEHARRLRLWQLVAELGPDVVWQIVREWAYGELELPSSERMSEEQEHAAGAAVRRLDGAAD